MSDNLIQNAGFEADWSDEENHTCFIIPHDGDPYEKEIGNIHVPPKWGFWFYHQPGTYDQPEGRDSRIAERIRSGNKSYMWFTFDRSHRAGLYQRVSGLTPGDTVEFSAWAHAWSNHNGEGFPHPNDGHWSEGAGYDKIAWMEGTKPSDTGDPQEDAKPNFTFKVGIDPTGGINPFSDNVVWSIGWHIYNGYVKELFVQAEAQSDTITVFIYSSTLWAFRHNDAYVDDAKCIVVNGEPPEPPGENGRPPLDPTPTDVSKIGVHVIRNASLLSEFIASQPAVVKFVGDWGMAPSVPDDTLVIGAKAANYDAQYQYNAGQTPKQAAQQFVDDMRTTYESNPAIKYWEGHNEPVWNTHDEMNWYAQFEIERMKLMANLGLKCVIGNFSTGAPRLELWASFTNACEIGLMYNAILGVHEYSCPWMWWMTGKYQVDPNEDQEDEGWTTLRYRKVYRQFLEPAGVGNIPLVITETGIDPLVNPKPPGAKSGTWKQLGDYWLEHDGEPDNADYYFRQLVWYDKELQKDDYVIGATIFTFGNFGAPWDKFDIAGTPVAEKLIDYITESHMVEPPEPPEPGECRGEPRTQYERTYVLLPPNANADWASAVIDATWNSKRYTLGGSADDAGIGDLDSRNVIAVNPGNWPGDMTLEEFFGVYYPGINLTSVIASTPQELYEKLADGITNTIFLSQKDTRWKDYIYKDGECYTIGTNGCWLTCTAMAMRYYAIDESATPVTVDETIGRSGYSGCEMTWNAMEKVGLEVAKSTTSEDIAKSHLLSGDVCFAEVQPGPSKHFVMVTEIENDRFWCYDPLASAPSWLDERYDYIESWRLIRKYDGDEPNDPPLYGMHDEAGGERMVNAGHTGVCLVHKEVQNRSIDIDLSYLQNEGVVTVCRLNYGYADGTGTFPPSDKRDAFIAACVTTMLNAKGVNYWIIGNEPNNESEWPTGFELTPKYCVDIYNEIYDQVKCCVRLGPFPIDPYFGPGSDNGVWQKYVWANIHGADAIYLHAKTQTNNPDEIFSFDKFSHEPLTWQYLHLRTIETSLEMIPSEYGNLPIFVTECNPSFKTVIGGEKGWIPGNAEWVSKLKEYFRDDCPYQIDGVMIYRYEKAGDQAPYGIEDDDVIFNEIFIGD